MKVRRAVVIAVAFAVLASAAEARADWPIYGHDLANSRYAGSDGPAASAVSSMKPAWTFNSSNGDFTGTPIVAGGVLVAGTNLGTVYAIDAVTGKQRWSHNVGQPVNGSAAIDLDAPGGPTAFVPVAQLGAPRLIALSLATGAARWDRTLTRQDGADVFGSPTFLGGTVYIGTSGQGNDESSARGSVVALDEANGKIRWQTFTVPPGHDGGAVWSTPAIDTATGRLYVGTGNAYHEPVADTTDAMMALSAANGQILGHFQSTPGDVWMADAPLSGPDYDFGASPNLIAGPDGRLLIGEGQKSGTYWALDRATMQPVWHTSAGPGSQADGGINSSAYDGARIYGSDAIDGQVFALGRDGSSQWSSDDLGPAEFSPVAEGNGVLYSANANGFLTARDAATGSLLTKLPLNAPTFGGISITGRAVYVSIGTGPPSPAQPVPGVDTSGSDGNGSIVAFGDTSHSGASERGPAQQAGGHPHQHALQLMVAPNRVRPRRSVVFRFRAVHGSRPVRGVAISLAGHRVHTGRDGRAALRLRLRHAGTYVVRARRPGLGATTTKVVAGNRANGGGGKGDPKPQPAPVDHGASTFSGSCTLSGSVSFDPPMTGAPQSINQQASASGPCSGDFTDRAGHAHKLDNTPVAFAEKSSGDDMSCTAGIATGSGTLTFPWGTIAFKFDERRVGGTPTLQLTGAKSGSALALATPSQSQDPVATLQACNGSGLKSFAFDAHSQTTPSISG